jgi:hypothetical protein
MMKTITEYRPLIFSEMASHSEQRQHRRRQWWINAPAIFIYCTLGFWMAYDTGVTPWQWQFWLMFAPLVAAVEIAIHALRPR